MSDNTTNVLLAEISEGIKSVATAITEQPGGGDLSAIEARIAGIDMTASNSILFQPVAGATIEFPISEEGTASGSIKMGDAVIEFTTNPMAGGQSIYIGAANNDAMVGTLEMVNGNGHGLFFNGDDEVEISGALVVMGPQPAPLTGFMEVAKISPTGAFSSYSGQVELTTTPATIHTFDLTPGLYVFYSVSAGGDMAGYGFIRTGSLGILSDISADNILANITENNELQLACDTGGGYSCYWSLMRQV